MLKGVIFLTAAIANVCGLSAAFGNPILPDNGEASNLSAYQLLPEERQMIEHDLAILADEICTHLGLAPNFIVFADNVPNAMSYVLPQGRAIMYNPDFLTYAFGATDSPEWVGTSILSHEMGHHLSWHMFDRSTSLRDKELEADQFSGFVMYRMGASLKQAQSFMAAAAMDFETPTHPARTLRLAAIKRGWLNAQELAAHEAQLDEIRP